MKPEIETVSTRLVYENRWMRLREDEIRRQDGSPGIYGVIEKPDFSLIMPFENDGSVHLVEQYRYPLGARFWEFPQGAWEGAPDASPETVARGELREETGLEAERLTEIGTVFAGYGYSTQVAHVFIAQHLVAGTATPEADEQGLVTRRFAWTEMLAMIRCGEIRDGATIAAIGLAHVHGLLPPG